MTKIISDANSSLKSDSAENCLIELLTYLEINKNFIASTNIQSASTKLSYVVDELLCKASFEVPAVQSLASNGEVRIIAQNVFNVSGWTLGTAGTFKSLNITQALLEISTFLQITEADKAKNPLEENRIISSFDLDDKTFSCEIELPIVLSVDGNGKTVLAIKEYLL